jgi:hypothetical protein
MQGRFDRVCGDRTRQCIGRDDACITRFDALARVFRFRPIYSSGVLLYNGIITSPSHDPSPKPPSDKTPVLHSDKTGNNRNAVSETSNALILPIQSPFQTFSNQPSDFSPDKTGHYRKIELKKSNFSNP